MCLCVMTMGKMHTDRRDILWSFFCFSFSYLFVGVFADVCHFSLSHVSISLRPEYQGQLIADNPPNMSWILRLVGHTENTSSGRRSWGHPNQVPLMELLALSLRKCPVDCRGNSGACVLNVFHACSASLSSDFTCLCLAIFFLGSLCDLVGVFSAVDL